MDYIWELYIVWHIAEICLHAFQCIHFKNDSLARANAQLPSKIYAVPDPRWSVELSAFLPGFLWVVVFTMRSFLMIFLQVTYYSYIHEEIGCGNEKNLRHLFCNGPILTPTEFSKIDWIQSFLVRALFCPKFLACATNWTCWSTKDLLHNAIICRSVMLSLTIRYNAEEVHRHNLCNISVMHFRGTRNMCLVILDATIKSGLIVHAVPGSGCVVPVMFGMFWRSRSAVT